jgi:hypothetical protein
LILERATGMYYLFKNLKNHSLLIWKMEHRYIRYAKM